MFNANRRRATERGRAGYDANRRDFNKLIWKNVSPKWDFDDATFDRTPVSFDNPDYVSIVIHTYRWRLSLAEGDLQYDDLEKRLAEGPVIAVPTITLDGDSDGVAPASDGTSYAKKFSGTHAPNHQGHRSQPVSRSPAGLCRSCRRSRRLLIGVSLRGPSNA